VRASLSDKENVGANGAGRCDGGYGVEFGLFAAPGHPNNRRLAAMSYNGSFHSFDCGKLEHALTHAREKVVNAVVNEMRELNFKPDVVERCVRVGKRVVESGFTYAGQPKGDLKVIDHFVSELFYLCASDIDSVPESPEFLSPRITAELPSYFQKSFFWSRPKPIPAADSDYICLTFFHHAGRRLGEQTPSACEYIALDLRETELLKNELEKFLSSSEGEQLDALYPNTIRKDFLGPVLSALGKGKALYARLS